MSAPPDQYGVVGHPVAHSWSPFIHGLFARQTEQAMVYRRFDVPPAKFRRHVTHFFLHGGRGLNVTLPHKPAAAELANELTPRAERAGAVNTLLIQGENEILGDNTDGEGLVRDLQDNCRVPVTATRILIVGAGGATRGVLAPLLALQPSEIVIANRTAARASALAREFAELGNLIGCGLDSALLTEFDLIINATSASTNGHAIAIPEKLVSARTICYDMAYSKEKTPFVRWAESLGCARALQGWGMLVEQAAESFSVWRGIRPQTAPVLEALTAS
ncbi:MAG TPA: shikimate dehydrogenase [Steroidobacteraceae bacterium]|jgi:shikimate dehydrogenase|nr:shikimate dehydrogenase [Steroidobacteraceae bacterium]